MSKANMLRLEQVVLATSSEDENERRFQDVFKTSSSRRMFAGQASIGIFQSCCSSQRNKQTKLGTTNKSVRQLFKKRLVIGIKLLNHSKLIRNDIFLLWIHLKIQPKSILPRFKRPEDAVICLQVSYFRLFLVFFNLYTLKLKYL